MARVDPTRVGRLIVAPSLLERAAADDRKVLTGIFFHVEHLCALVRLAVARRRSSY
jgi:hypothetical protein